jgi:hypothetical protein
MGQETKQETTEPKTFRVKTIFGTLEIIPNGDKYVWRIVDKDLDTKEIPEEFGFETNTFEDAIREAIDFLLGRSWKLEQYEQALITYSHVRDAYKTWKSEVLPQLEHCIEFTVEDDHTKFTTKCPEWKLKELEKKIDEIFDGVVSVVFNEHVPRHDIGQAIREIREMQSQFPANTFEEPLRNVLGRAITLLHQILNDLYMQALYEILYPEDVENPFDEPVEEEETEEEPMEEEDDYEWYDWDAYPDESVEA